ncbi:MAG TPA: Qat anti-phage system TatD family nuclease QatD [Oculatellaceae cyanobacterium]
MIDFHAHLDLYPNPHNVVKECIARRMYVLSVTTTPSAWTGTSALIPPGTRIRTALGLHPQLAHERSAELELFDAYLDQVRYVGEIGLDGAPEFKPHRDRQTAVFQHILNACSKAGGKIMSVHSRRAAAEVIDLLRKFPGAGTPVLHWYSGNKRDLDAAISSGCWFSIGPAMLRGVTAKSIISKIPRNRILTETDGPFVQINGHAAMPWEAQSAVIGLQEIWGVTLEEAEGVLHENLKSLVSS